jgi:hypothetical protein
MKRLWRYLKIIITIGIMSLFIYYFIDNREDFLVVLSTPFEYIFLIGIFNFLVFLLNGIFIRVILISFKKTIGVFESLYVQKYPLLGNSFLPTMGCAVIRSVYLKKRFSFPYSHFVSTLYGYYIIF